MKDIFDFQNDPYLKILRPLVETYKAIFEIGGRHIRSMGLTPPQFDVIAELGGTNGLTAVELSHSTLLAKASLTGIVDRLESKGLVKRYPLPGDRRATRICLTERGENLYRTCFPAQANFVRAYFERAVSKRDIQILLDILNRLRESCRADGNRGKVGDRDKFNHRKIIRQKGKASRYKRRATR